jgi:hypothetical protein
MDLIKELMELNNELTLSKISSQKYTIDSDDDDEDIKYIHECRQKFIHQYHKVNNRQFKKSSSYMIDEYQKQNK